MFSITLAKKHWVLSRSDTLNKYEEKQTDFDGVILNKLYDTAMAIRSNNHDNTNNKNLFSSINQKEAVVEAAVHIAYILTELKDKVLIVNLDSSSTETVEKYIHSNAKPNLFTTLEHSIFLSDAINHTKYERLDIIHVEGLEKQELLKRFSQHNLLSKVSHLKSYYNHIFLIGPEFQSMENYGAILELADTAVTVISSKKNDRHELNHYLQKINLFNVKSFGILRKAD